MKTKTTPNERNASAGGRAREFTPGPWTVHRTCHVKPFIGGGFYHVAHVGCADPEAKRPILADVLPSNSEGRSEKAAHEPDPEQAANARLIAAAPETAAECDRLRAINRRLVKALQRLKCCGGPGGINAENYARAAIAKAISPPTETEGRGSAEKKGGAGEGMA